MAFDGAFGNEAAAFIRAYFCDFEGNLVSWGFITVSHFELGLREFALSWCLKGRLLAKVGDGVGVSSGVLEADWLHTVGVVLLDLLYYHFLAFADGLSSLVRAEGKAGLIEGNAFGLLFFAVQGGTHQVERALNPGALESLLRLPALEVEVA